MPENGVTENSKLRPPEAARYLRMAVSTLAKLRCYGGGPRFAKAGPRLVIYDRADLDAWLADRICHSTSEYETIARQSR
jgi:predicted DNA-binding transcriptional regulator AlpA